MAKAELTAGVSHGAIRAAANANFSELYGMMNALQSLYASQAAGEAATANGAYFAVQLGNSITFRQRTANGSTLITSVASTPTPTPTPTASINPISLGYVDDFEAPGNIAGRANFAVLSGTWTADGNGTANGGSLQQTVQWAGDSVITFGNQADAVNGFGQRMRFIVDWTNKHSSIAAYAGDDVEPQREQMRAYYVDENNYLGITITTGRINLLVKVAGNYTTSRFDDSAIGGTDVTARLIVEIDDGKVRANYNGRWLEAHSTAYSYPFDVADLTATLPQVNRKGLVSFYKQTYRNPSALYVAADTLRITVDDLKPFFGRKTVANTSISVPVSGKYFGTPAAWFYRVLATDGTPGAWQTFTPTTAANNAYAGTVTVNFPAGGGGPYSLEIGYNEGVASYTATSKQFVIGVFGIYFGQSNAYMRGDRAWTGTNEQNIATSLIRDPATYKYWRAPFRKTGVANSIHELANILSAQLGVPAGVLATGQSGASLSLFLNNGQGWANMVAHVNGAASPDDIEFVCWDQGEGDADSTFMPTYYSNDVLTQLLPALRAFTGKPNLPFLINVTGRYASATPPNGGDGAANDAQRNELHKQFLQIVANDAHSYLMAHDLGREHNDPYHYTGAGYTEGCRRDAWSVLKNVYGHGTHDGYGPTLTAATRNGATITLSASLNGSTGLVAATGLTGYQVSTDNGVTWTTPQSAAVVGNDIVLTLSSAPGASVQVRSYYGWSYDDSALAYGAYSDTANIPVAPIIVPLVSN